MNFGPLMPQEVDKIIAFLEKRQIPFEMHFNRDDAQKELSSENIENNLGLAEWRTRTYLAQHFYIEITDEYLLNNPKVEKEILAMITKDESVHLEQPDEHNIIPIDEQKQMDQGSKRNKTIQRVIAVLFLISMLYGFIATLKK